MTPTEIASLEALADGVKPGLWQTYDAYIDALTPDVAKALIARVERAEAALKLAHPYAEQAIKDDGGIENCEIGDRLALEKIRTALAALEAS